MFNEGDNVYVIRYSFSSRALDRAKVERVTKTQAIITGGAKFNRETGREIGNSGSYSSRRIEPRTPQLDSQWRSEFAAVALSRLAGVARDSQSEPEQIRSAYAAWDKAERAIREGE